MYDKEQKWAFINDFYTSEAERARVTRLFAHFTPYEQSWNRDLVLQPIDRLQPAFSEIAKTISTKQVNALLAVLKQYRTWYLSHNDVNAVCAGVLQLKVSNEEKLRRSMVASPMNLKLVLDEVFDLPEKETVDCVYRALLWLAFAGVPRTQATLITVDEVDFYEMQIRHGGKNYKIFAEGLKEFQKLCELDTFLFIHKNPDYEQRRPRTEGNQLLRGLGDVAMEAKRISNEISKHFTNSKWFLTYDNVLDSGLFYEKYELERFGLAVSFDAETEQRLAEMTGLNNSAIINNRSIIRKRYYDKYNQWKAIFNLQLEEE